MELPPLFQENFKRWLSFCPQAIEFLIRDPFPSADSSNFPIENELEAASAAVLATQAAEDSSFKAIYLYGLAHGAGYRALKQWCSQEGNFLIILEDQPEEILHFLQTEEAKELLHAENVWLLYFDPNFRLLDQVGHLFADLPYIVSTIKSDAYSLNKTEELRSQIAFFHHLYEISITEKKSMGLPFYGNFMRNLFQWPISANAMGLYGQFRNIPAIICGAGPSIAKNIDTLRQLKDQALIFAGGTAMNALNANDFIPHLGVGVDPNHEFYSRLIMNNAFEVPFLYRNRMFSDGLKFVHGDKIYVPGHSGYSTSQYFEEGCGIESATVEDGANVINFSLSLATAMGCNPIILVGVDLAYSNDKSYAPGLVNHPFHSHRSFFISKSGKDELILKNDIYGKPVYTLWKWITESIWFSKFTSKHPETTYINSTEGGIGFPGIVNVPLAEVAERHLQRHYPIECRLLGAIQQHKLPATNEKILALMQTLNESLLKAAEALKVQQNELMDLQENSEAVIERTMMDLKNSFLEWRTGTLADNPSYKFFLNIFEDFYDSLNIRAYKRLNIDQDILNAEEKLIKSLDLELGRLDFLQVTAAANSNLIEKIMTQHREEKKVEKVVFPSTWDPVPSLRGCCYHYDGKILTLIDKECGLDHTEEFCANEEDIQQEYNSEGILLCETSRRNGKLHGPSRVFDTKGNILAETWYLENIPVGKALVYYPSKALHSMRQYQKGRLCGRQINLYPDGTVRSLFTCNEEGRFHGTVYLFYPSGAMKRALEFRNGQRNGSERLWSEKGTVVLDVHFANGRPAKTMHAWHNNGVLAQEAHYNTDGLLQTASHWDVHGHALKINPRQERDYFKQVAKNSQEFTYKIEGIINEFKAFAPLVIEATSQAEGKEAGAALDESREDLKKLAENLAGIDQGLEILRKLDHELVAEANLDVNSANESFWKTEAMEKEIRAQLDIFTRDLQVQLSELQTNFSKIIQALTERQRTKD